MKLHIFDNGFANKVGHSFEYTKSVYEEWVARGNEAFVYCTHVEDEAVEKSFNTIPIFTIDARGSYLSIKIPQSVNKFLRLNGILNAFAGSRSFLNDLKKIDARFLSEDDIVLVHTLNQNSLFAIYLWYRSLPQSERPRLVLLFRFATMHYDREKRRLPSYFLYQLLMKLFVRLDGNEKVIFTTDSDALAEEYETMTTRKVNVLPIPHIPILPHKPKAGHNEEKVFVYIGEANERKGYYLLPAAIDFVVAHHARRNLKFLIQSNCPRDPGEKIVLAKKELSVMGGGVEIIDRALDTKEYYNLLSRADIVLIPYVAESYHAQTSGIFAEALAFSKPVIIPVDTWMEREFLKYESGGVLFRMKDEGSLGKAMIFALEHETELKKRANACMISWTKYHNARTYVDILLRALQNQK
jgi:glycosyltransferase involved in cell wall biosynthesis